MKISVLKPHELTADLVERWAEIQSSHSSYISPYLRPEFTQAVARARNNVEIALLEEGGEAVGFFPYERGFWGAARPVGNRLSDFQAVVVRPDIRWSATDLLQSCRLNAWAFDHLLVAQQPFANYHRTQVESVYLDLSQGFDAYRAARRSAGSEEINQVFQKLRKVERTIGPVRFVTQTDEESVFSQLLRWKSEQYRRTGRIDLFRFPWVVKLLRDIWAHKSDTFRGVLSALYFGDEVVAIHFGMRCRNVLHSWFPAYNRDVSKHSPGLMMNVMLAREFAPLGVTRIDLGKGSEPYKLHFRSHADLVAEGSADLRPWSLAIKSRWHATREWARGLGIKQQLQTPIRWFRHLRDWCDFA